VSEGGGLTVAAVDSVAQGRVWSGLAAKRLGLVDEFGGINEAIEIAREKAKIDADADLLVEVYPRPRRTFVQNWVSRLFKDDDSDSDTQLAAVRELFAWYRASTVARRGVQALMPYSIHIE
jgi:protease-4